MADTRGDAASHLIGGRSSGGCNRSGGVSPQDIKAKFLGPVSSSGLSVAVDVAVGWLPRLSRNLPSATRTLGALNPIHGLNGSLLFGFTEHQFPESLIEPSIDFDHRLAGADYSCGVCSEGINRARRRYRERSSHRTGLDSSSSLTAQGIRLPSV